MGTGYRIKDTNTGKYWITNCWSKTGTIYTSQAYVEAAMNKPRLRVMRASGNYSIKIVGVQLEETEYPLLAS